MLLLLLPSIKYCLAAQQASFPAMPSPPYYLVNKHAGRPRADEVIDWLLERFEVAEANSDVFRQARNLSFRDYEDAVVAAMAERAKCDCILTRNAGDFSSCRVLALTPSEWLERESHQTIR